MIKEKNVTVTMADATTGTVKITYNPNGGSFSGSLSNDSVTSGGEYTVRGLGTGANEVNFISPNSDKLVFDGWNTKSDGTGVAYVSQQKVSSWNYDTDVILYAQWAPASKVTFSLNGATSSETVDSIVGKVGSQITIPTIPSITNVPENYHSTGTWNTKADGTGTTFSPGDSYTLTADDLALYLTLAPDAPDPDAKLTFNTNGADATTDSTILNGISVDSNMSVVLPTTILTKSLNRFVGWSINGTTYSAGTTIQIDYSTTATAVWQATQSIIYSDGVPTGSTDVVSNMPNNDVVDATGATYVFSTNIPIRTDTTGRYVYTFLYWRLDNQVNIAPGGSWKTNTTPASWSLVAVWNVLDTESQYTISYNGNGNTGGTNPSVSVVSKGGSIQLSGQGSLVKENFEFVGWKDSGSSDEQIYQAGSTFTPTGNTVLLAVWQQVNSQGTLIYDAQASSGSNPAAITGNIGDSITLSDVLSDNTPPSSGYHFWGWATTKSATVPDYYAGQTYTLSSGITTLYGVWASIDSQYWAQIKINTNDSDGNVTAVLENGYSKNQTFNLNSSTDVYEYVVPTVTRTGYTFNGWKYSKDGKIYQPGDIISLTDLSETKDPGVLTAQWEEITFNIKYSSGTATAGTVPTTDVVQVQDGDSYVVLGNTGNLSRDGYTFIGWSDGVNTYGAGQKLLPSSDLTFVPVWKKNPSSGGSSESQYANIIYVALESGITGDLPDSTSVEINGTNQYTVANPEDNFSYSGYTFIGWYTLDANGNQVYYSPGTTFVVTGNMVFYAGWISNSDDVENSYTILFNGNGNTSGLVPNPIYVTKSQSGTMPGANTLVRTEYIYQEETGAMKTEKYLFIGWSTRADAKVGDSDVILSGETFTPNADTIYYAVWDIVDREVTLTYDLNGGIGELPSSVTDNRYAVVTVDPSGNGTGLTKEVNNGSSIVKYVFIGWNTSADGSGYSFYPGGALSLDADWTLYAQWMPISENDGSRIIYIGNGNTSGVYMHYDDTTDTTYKITDPGTVKKAGYIFVGWNTAANGSGTAYNVGQIINLPNKIGLVLYAQWQAVTAGKITVIYNGNGNTSGQVPDSYVGDSGSTVTISGQNTLQRTGYSFIGWSPNPSATNVTIYGEGSQNVFTDNTVLYAMWAVDGNYIATPAEVTYNPNYSGENGNYIVEGAVDANAEVNDVTVLSGHKVVANEKNGGAYLGESYTVVDYGVTGLPSRDNYIFLGWSTDPNATTPEYTGNQVIQSLSDKTLVLYAVWQQGNYTISYDANGGIGTMSDQTALIDEESQLTKNSFNRPGYTFQGWNTSKDGTGNSYTDQDSVINLASAGENILLYAIWTADEQTINFDANGGTTTQGSISQATDSTVDLSNVAGATRPGYTFEGWYTAAT
ncbi:InlB B-repeat-containing protein, partial [Lactiplantibacillus plantarum]|nr:InlB B-repeat-containing protein [Lactiplantibacillus plantarum]